MFPLLKKESEKLYIDRGMVMCPLRGHDVEVDECAGCRWLEAIDEQAKPAFLRCSPRVAPLEKPLIA